MFKFVEKIRVSLLNLQCIEEWKFKRVEVRGAMPSLLFSLWYTLLTMHKNLCGRKFSADLTCILVINTSVIYIGLLHKHVCKCIVSNQEPFLGITTMKPGTFSWYNHYETRNPCLV